MSEQVSKQVSKQASKRREEEERERERAPAHQETAPQKTSAVPVKYQASCWTSDLEKLSGPLLDLGPTIEKISGPLLDLPTSKGQWFQMWAP